MRDTAEAAHTDVQTNATDPSFIVGQDGSGHWLAVETHGLGGGIFVTRDAALGYARAETGRRKTAVRLTQDLLALQ